MPTTLKPLWVGLTLALLTLGCKRDSSLVDVVTNHPDEFPEPYLAITPPSQVSALGLSAPSPPTGDAPPPPRRAVLGSAECFFVSKAPHKPGLSTYHVRYSLSKDLQAELDLIAAKVGVDLDAVKHATLKLEDLRIEQVVLAPNPDGGCAFEEQTTPLWVFTRQIVAATASLDFGVRFTLKPGVHVPLGNTAATLGVEGGWVVASETSLSGKDIVIAAMPELWKVELSAESYNLGPTPKANEYVVPGTSASVSVISYDANGPTLKLQVNTSLNQDSELLPTGWMRLGTTLELTTTNQQVNLLPAPGNRPIMVRWSRRPSEDDPEISVVWLDVQSLVATKGAE